MLIFKCSILLKNQLLISIILLFILFEISWASEHLIFILVSSPKGNGLDVSKMDIGISLIQCNKSDGASMEPGGAPALTRPRLEDYCLSLLSLSTPWKLFFK